MRVKGYISLLTAILIASALPQAAIAADLPSFEIKSVSSTMIDPGDTVTWKIQVNLIPGWTKGLVIYLIDPVGQERSLPAEVEKIYDVKEKKSVEIELSLKTNEFDLAGKYKLQWGWITNVEQVTYYDPINGKAYAGKGGANTFAQNLNKFDFTIRDSGSGKQKTPQFIDSIGFSKTQINPGTSANLELKTSGTGSLDSANVWLATPDGTISIYCSAVNMGNSGSCQGILNSNGKYEFSMPIWTAGDSSPGNYKIKKVLLNYRNGDPPAEGNNTANWGGYVYYEETEVLNNGVKSQLLSQFPQSGLSFTLLDAGQGVAQTPVWTELAWKNKNVKAGTIATLLVTANGFSRYLGNISVSILTTLGRKNEFIYTNQSGQTANIRQIKPNTSNTILPAVQSGTFEIDVYVPRNAKPGTYAIGQLILLSTTCELSTSQFVSGSSQANNLNCQTWPNGWGTSFYMGSLSKNFGSSGITAKTWPGYVNPLAVQLEVTAADPLEAPKIEEVDTTSTAIEYRYLYSSEQSCVGSASAGELVDDKLINDGYWTLKVNNLKPDSPVSITLTCADATDAKATSTLISRTTKPIPPASPKLTLDSVTTDSAIFSIFIREGFDYTVKSESGKAEILGNKESGYKVEVSGLKPGVKTNLVATITDSYMQSTSSEPLYFAAELPPVPLKPIFTIGKVTTNRVEFKYEKLDDLDYELTVSEGSVIDSNGSVTVIGLTPNTKITAVVKVIDQYGQSMISEDLIIKTAVPVLRALPVLYLVKTGSNSISLRFTPSSGMKYIAKTSAGLANVVEGSIIISGLKPLQKVQVSLEMRDAYEQVKTSDFYTYTTGPAPKTPAKLTITCIKGKTSKLITAVNPKCPSGFKKK
jgi:hypothetical protein